MVANQAGYSGKSVIEKLGIKDNMSLYFQNLPKEFNLADWGNMPPVKITKSLEKELDFIHCFFTSLIEYQTSLPNLQSHLKSNGMIWVSWPKKTSKITSDLDENKIRNFALGLGLVDIKVCAIDTTWSGLKLVIRKSNR
ncbi:DUF3052 domain-containing protein [Leptospira levettii]|uniref:DUF3052 domain-containing protein n=1 Tax=Leptospira levettii TaxID=2023178 RepID=UPI001EEBC3C4|nr:DUF3052 domain-containing protein [Leptospira levettii]MCG6147384.1 DUF3052 domain-containing protein [Leptospira levettii]